MVTCVADPAGTLDGLTETIVGTTVGCVMVNIMGVDGPPPGEGLDTVTCTVPGVAISAVEIVANISCVLFTVVAFGVLLKLSTAAAAKFDPAASSEKGSEPATTVVG
jgi:hypothetical protein